MYRYIYEDLLKWKKNKDRKPLILNGARQVGKTWILKEFGIKEYKSFAYVSCDNAPQINDVFYDYDIPRIIRALSALTNVNILEEETLIVLDEVQECPKALTSLKYFCENASKYHIIVAGSLLGISLHEGSGFPVGKVDRLNIYPLSFNEFLLALGKDKFLEIMSDPFESNALRSDLIELLRQYYFVGGMPEAVFSYITDHDVTKIRNIQNRIIEDYDDDFSKHVPLSILPKVRMVWNSIPSQLAKENKKFIYSAIKKGGRAKEFESAIQWLIDAGLIYKVTRVKAIRSPLKFYEDIDAFKLYVLDLGLLGAMSSAKPASVLIGDNVFKEYKGAFSEQYVLQQLILNNIKPYYYTNDNSTVEIDFVIETNDIHPIEVKAEENLRSKSLKSVLEGSDYIGYRFSMSPYRNNSSIVNIPLYLIQNYTR